MTTLAKYPGPGRLWLWNPVCWRYLLYLLCRRNKSNLLVNISCQQSVYKQQHFIMVKHVLHHFDSMNFWPSLTRSESKLLCKLWFWLVDTNKYYQSGVQPFYHNEMHNKLYKLLATNIYWQFRKCFFTDPKYLLTFP